MELLSPAREEQWMLRDMGIYRWHPRTRVRVQGRS